MLDWQTQGRARMLARGVRLPLQSWRDAGRAVARFGAEVETVAGVSRAAQRRQLWWLMMRHGMNATSYLDYQLYRPERRTRAAEYVQEREFFRVVRWYNRQHADSDAMTMIDKDRFAAWCQRHDCPTVAALLEYANGAAFAPDGSRGGPARELAAHEVEARLPAGDLFTKPSGGTGGFGTQRWRYTPASDGAHAWTGSDGRARSAAELHDEFTRIAGALRPRRGRDMLGLLVQPCLRNHRDLLPLTPGALCTVRVVTYRTPGGAARTLLAAFKMATGDAPADNFHFGGIVAPVDLATGRLGVGIRRVRRVLVPAERHPDTNAVIPGHELPHWRATIALAERAFAATRRVPLIGWDIAITDDGPVLIEGNPASNPDIAQAPTGIPLCDTPFPSAVNAHVAQFFSD